ncbi:oxidoreductase [Salibacteraceae bacterium]|nr:oxidoreductase [Salibacteraceae bacterium]
MSWNLLSVTDQKGKIAIVTGANIGLGLETTKALTQKGVHVIMACRNLDKAKVAKASVLADNSNAQLTIMQLDLNDFTSVKSFASEYLSNHSQLDFLINNAGIMMPPCQKTKDGFESQFGVNYLSHFLLTGLLIDVIKNTKNSRIVTVSSAAHKWGDIQFDDYNFEKAYDKRNAYGQSKLACLMFAYEMQRRLEKHGINTLSLAAHPGVSDTNLGKFLPGFVRGLAKIIGPFIFNSAADGALPTLRAALDEKAKGGEYYGPDGKNEMKGKPVKVDSTDNSKDKEKAARLWSLSEELTGINYLD